MVLALGRLKKPRYLEKKKNVVKATANLRTLGSHCFHYIRYYELYRLFKYTNDINRLHANTRRFYEKDLSINGSWKPCYQSAADSKGQLVEALLVASKEKQMPFKTEAGCLK